MKAVHITDNKWRVTDGSLSRLVFVSELNNTADAAIAAYTEAREGPSPEQSAAIAAADLEAAKTRDLTPTEMDYLLAITGMEDVWDAAEAALKPVDLELYAQVRAQRRALRYRLSEALRIVSLVRDSGVSVSADEEIRAAWEAVATTS